MYGQYNTAILWDEDRQGGTVLFFATDLTGEYKIAGQYHVNATDPADMLYQAAYLALEDGIIDHSNIVLDTDQWIVIPQIMFNRVYRQKRHRTLWYDDKRFDSEVLWNKRYIYWIN